MKATPIVTLISLVFFISLTVNAQPDIPVDPLTGKAQVVIPIWTLTSSSLSAPIALAYSGGGVKVEESEGSAGMSWNLIAGGSVSRQVNGLPDDYIIPAETRKGWLWDAAKTTIAAFSPTADDACTHWTNVSTLVTGYDTEPDIFYANAPGLSVKFLYSNTGVIVMMPWQDLKITPTIDGNQRISQFEIVTNQGVKYIFSEVSETTRSALSLVSSLGSFQTEFANRASVGMFHSSWGLTSITGPSGEQLLFDYADPITSVGRDKRRKVNAALNNVETIYEYEDLTSTPLLTSISSASTTVNLHRNMDTGLLVGVSVQSLVSTKTRVFNLVYTVVP